MRFRVSDAYLRGGITPPLPVAGTGVVVLLLRRDTHQVWAVLQASVVQHLFVQWPQHIDDVLASADLSKPECCHTLAASLVPHIQPGPRSMHVHLVGRHAGQVLVQLLGASHVDRIAASNGSFFCTYWGRVLVCVLVCMRAAMCVCA